MVFKKKIIKKNKVEINEMIIIVEDSFLSKLNVLNGFLEGSNSFSCVFFELIDIFYGFNFFEGLSKMR